MNVEFVSVLGVGIGIGTSPFEGVFHAKAEGSGADKERCLPSS